MFNRLKKAISNVMPYIFTRENAWIMTKAAILTGIGMGLDYLAPYLVSEAIAVMTTEAASTTIVGIEFSPLGLIAASGTAAWGRQLVSNYTSTVLAPLGPGSAEKLLMTYAHAELNGSQESRRQIDTGKRDFIIQNVSRIDEVTNALCSQVIPTFGRVVVGGIVLSKNYGTQLGFSLGGIVALHTVYSVLTKKMISEARDQVQAHGNDAYQDLSGILKNVETAQVNNTEDTELQNIKKSTGKFFNSLINAKLTGNRVSRGQDLLINLGQTALCLLAGKAVLEQKLTVQDYVLISTYLAEFFTPLGMFGSAVNDSVSGLIALETVFDRIDSAKAIPDNFPENKLEFNEAKIEFKNVSFSYNEDKNLFNNLSLIINQGEKIGIVGTKGSGKSSLTNLLYRFYDVTSGQILIGGVDIRNIGLKNLRTIIGIIQQKSVIFNKSIFENIAYGALSKKELVTRQSVEKASEKAHLDFVEEYKDKFDTLVGETGVKLSGGQEQCVAFARAIMKDPKILICDEATASLDSLTESSIQSELDKLWKSENITLLVVTHRLKTVVNADKILVFDNGKLVESGTHTELLQNNGYYKKLWDESMREVSQNSIEFKKVTNTGLGFFDKKPNQEQKEEQQIEITIKPHM